MFKKACHKGSLVMTHVAKTRPKFSTSVIFDFKRDLANIIRDSVKQVIFSSELREKNGKRPPGTRKERFQIGKNVRIPGIASLNANIDESCIVR
jgi:hypothetical protein